MKNEKSFKELNRILAHEGIRAILPERQSLPVLLNGKPICHMWSHMAGSSIFRTTCTPRG